MHIAEIRQTQYEKVAHLNEPALHVHFLACLGDDGERAQSVVRGSFDIDLEEGRDEPLPWRGL